MTRDQREELYTQWDLYEPDRQKEIVAEYFANGGAFCQKSWEHYLKDKLETERHLQTMAARGAGV
ncbi:MAG: hypothetical protein ACN4GW_00435 [Desulforhopalus sp.]